MLDIEKVEQVKELLGDAFDSLLENYVEDAKNYIHDIETGVQQSNAEIISQAAHPLKSSSYNVGFERLGDLAEKWELHAKNVMQGTEPLRANHNIAAEFTQLLEESIEALNKL